MDAFPTWDNDFLLIKKECQKDVSVTRRLWIPFLFMALKYFFDQVTRQSASLSSAALKFVRCEGNGVS